MTSFNHNNFYAMGTRCSVVLPDVDDEDSDNIYRNIENEIRRIEAMLSRFQPESDISRLNREAAKQPVPVKKELFQILKACHYYYKISGGCFDITLRPVLQYWKEHPGGDREAVKRLLEHLGADKISLRKKDCLVSFDNEYTTIDLGGFGKGYALEEVHKKLLRYGITSAFISMGESSILTMGNHPAGDCWKVGIKDYMDHEKALHTFNVRYGSVSTSSNFFVNDRGELVNHKHVIDPFTGVPLEKLITVSVCSESAVVAEVMSTAFLVMPADQIKKVKEQLKVATEVLRADYTSGKAEISVF